jgi:hypothetical protein
VSNISDDEMNVLLQQLIDQTMPERPSHEDAIAVVRWAEGVRIDHQMLAMVLKGDATVRIVDGNARYRLTAKGKAAAEELMRKSPAAREMHDRIAANALGKQLGKGPDDPQ